MDGSLSRRICGDKESQELFSVWPFARSRAGKGLVNRAPTEAAEKTIRICLKKGKPYGSKQFVTQAAARLKITHTLRPRGRHKIERAASPFTDQGIQRTVNVMIMLPTERRI